MGFSSLEIIEQQLAKLMPLWEDNQQDVDLSRRIAKLWEERYDQLQDEESLNGAIWYADHLKTILGGSDPALVRKLADLGRKRADAGIKKIETDILQIEKWLAFGGDAHEEAPKYRELLAEMQRQLAELKSELPCKSKPPRNPGLN